MKSPSLGVLGTLVVCVLIFTSSATATNTVDFISTRGALSGTTAGLSLSGSTLIAVIGLIGGGVITRDLRPLSSNTGSPANASLAIVTTVNPGRLFTINRSGLRVFNNDLFAGTFSGTVTWTLIPLANRTHNYSVSGVGMIAGKVVDTIMVQTISAAKRPFQKPGVIEADDTTFAGGNKTSISSIPEPSTFTLLLTGGVSTLGMMRYKVFTRKRRNKHED
jgi:hypothetical protein